MKRLTTDDSPERLIDDVRIMGGTELAGLEADGWRLLDVAERQSRGGAIYYRHRFRHVSAPHKGVI